MDKTMTWLRSPAFVALIVLALFSLDAQAQINSADMLDNVLQKYSNAASAWGAVITRYASWLFWTLALISLVWTFGMMVLKKADVGEFFAETARFLLFTGFFYWLLANGPTFAVAIMDSLRQIGAEASGTGSQVNPSKIVDIGFDIFFRVLDHSSVWSPVDSAIGIIISAIVLVVFALIGVNMLILLISGWLLAFAGVFFLGFGGSRWTSEIAIGYFKTVLSVAAQLFTMVLLVGIGSTFVNEYYQAMSAGISLKELGVMLIAAIVLLMLITKVPPLIGSLGGAHTHAIGSSVGVGAAMGAAAMGAAAAATAGAAAVAGAANIGGGAQALMTAFSQARNAEGAGGGAGDLLASAAGGGEGGGSGDGVGSGPLAAAMGDNDTGGSLGSAASTSSFADTGGFSTSTDSQGGSAAAGSSSGSPASATGGSTSAGSGTSSIADAGAPGAVKSGGALAAAGAMAAKAGRIAGGTAANLAHGSWDHAKAKGTAFKDAALDRMADTTGGKIAAAINARAESGKTAPPTTPPVSPDPFGGNSLSGASTDDQEADAKIAAFRSGGPLSA